MPSKEDNQHIREDISEVKDSVSKLTEKVGHIDKTLAEYKVAFDHHTKQDEKMYEELARNNDILQNNTDSLKQHMRRTELLEQAVMKMDERLSPLEVENIKSQAVREWRKQTIITMAKLLSGLGALGGIVVAAVKLIHVYL